MSTTIQFDTSTDDSIEAKREVIRQSLNEIAIEASNGLRDANLSYPLYLVVPTAGKAIVSMVTPADPGDPEWSTIGKIIRAIVSERLGGIELRSVEIPCTMVNETIGERNEGCA